jgi:hypothetical protein
VRGDRQRQGFQILHAGCQRRRSIAPKKRARLRFPLALVRVWHFWESERESESCRWLVATTTTSLPRAMVRIRKILHSSREATGLDRREI